VINFKSLEIIYILCFNSSPGGGQPFNFRTITDGNSSRLLQIFSQHNTAGNPGAMTGEQTQINDNFIKNKKIITIVHNVSVTQPNQINQLSFHISYI